MGPVVPDEVSSVFLLPLCSPDTAAVHWRHQDLARPALPAPRIIQERQTTSGIELKIQESLKLRKDIEI